MSRELARRPSTCAHEEKRKSGRWICVLQAGHGFGRHYMVLVEPIADDPICPDCRDGKCDVCLGSALDDKSDRIVDCYCKTTDHSLRAGA